MRTPRFLPPVVLIATLISAPAFPPAPHHTLYGVVRNKVGTPLGTGDATIILSGPAGEVRRVAVDSSAGAGLNYRLRISEDSSKTSQLYTPTALVPTSPFTIRVQIGSTSYLPIQMQGQLRTLGAAGASTRLDLTLGVDSDGDGLPDDWENDVIDFDPDDDINGLGDVRPGDDIDGDGMTNLSEYIAGTYAFDRLDGLRLEIKEVTNGVATLEFVMITGRTYHITSSLDGAHWETTPFTLGGATAEPATHHLASSVTLVRARVAVGENPHTLFKLYVE